MRDLPMARARRCVPPAPGMTPRLISGWPNLAVGEARMMSVERASSQPPPSYEEERMGVNEQDGGVEVNVNVRRSRSLRR